MRGGNQSVAGRCTGKFRFQTPQQAWDLANREQTKHRRPIRHYRCPECGGFHVGNRPKDRIKRA